MTAYPSYDILALGCFYLLGGVCFYMKKNNLYIELLRFIFCIIICLHHSAYVAPGTSFAPSGGLVADAFFMLTGYFTFRHVEKKYYIDDQKVSTSILRSIGYSIKYTLKKILRLYPYILFGSVMIYLLEIRNMTRVGIGIRTFFPQMFKEFLVEATLLPLTGLLQGDGSTMIITFRNTPMWFMSAMLLALPIFTFLLINLNKYFKYVLVWILPPVLQVFMLLKFGGILPFSQFYCHISSGVIRAFSDFFIGGMIYYFAKLLVTKFNDFAKCSTKASCKVILTIIELGLLALFLRNIFAGSNNRLDVISIYAIAISLAISLSGLSYTSNLKGNKIISFLGNISLPIYCVHWAVYRWMVEGVRSYIHTENSYALIVFAISASFILSTILIKIYKNPRTPHP